MEDLGERYLSFMFTLLSLLQVSSCGAVSQRKQIAGTRTPTFGHFVLARGNSALVASLDWLSDRSAPIDSAQIVNTWSRGASQTTNRLLLLWPAGRAGNGLNGRTSLATPCKVKLRSVAACTLAQDGGGGGHAQRRRLRLRGSHAHTAFTEIENSTWPYGSRNSGG